MTHGLNIEREQAGSTASPNAPAPRSNLPAASRKRPWWASAFIAVLAAIVIFNLIYALPRYLSFNPAASRVPLNPNYPLHLHFTVIVLHVIAGNLALVTLFIQVIPWIRRRYPVVHRIAGRVYVFGGALPCALLALALLPYNNAPFGNFGLLSMAILWIVTTVAGWVTARQRRYRQHRRWMAYSFALALGTTWGRAISQVAIPGVGINLAIFFDISSWMGWVITLVIVHWWLERTSKRPLKLNSHQLSVVKDLRSLNCEGCASQMNVTFSLLWPAGCHIHLVRMGRAGAGVPAGLGLAVRDGRDRPVPGSGRAWLPRRRVHPTGARLEIEDGTVDGFPVVVAAGR